jgi:hypothetical protein
VFLAGCGRSENPEAAAVAALIRTFEANHRYPFTLQSVAIEKTEEAGTETKYLHFVAKATSANDYFVQLNAGTYIDHRDSDMHYLATKALPYFPKDVRTRLEAEIPRNSFAELYRLVCRKGDEFVFDGQATASVKNGQIAIVDLRLRQRIPDDFRDYLAVYQNGQFSVDGRRAPDDPAQEASRLTRVRFDLPVERDSPPVTALPPNATVVDPGDEERRRQIADEVQLHRAFFNKVSSEAQKVDAAKYAEMESLRTSFEGLNKCSFRFPENGPEPVAYVMEISKDYNGCAAHLYRQGESSSRLKYSVEAQATPIQGIIGFPDPNYKFFEGSRIALVAEPEKAMFPKAKQPGGVEALFVTYDPKTKSWRIKIGEETVVLQPDAK